MLSRFSGKWPIIYILLLSAAITGMILLVHHKPENRIEPRDFDKIRSEGILRIVTEYSQPGYYIAGNGIEGFQYELSREIARLSGLETQLFLETSLEKGFDGLLTHRYDVMALNIPATSELKEKYLFTEPVLLDRQVLVQRVAGKNSRQAPIRNQLDLANKTLHIPKQSPALLRLHHLQHEIGDTIHLIEEPLYTSEQLVAMVAKGQIDYTVCDRRTARLMQKQLTGIDIRTDIGFTQFHSWVVEKNAPALCDSLNHWFQILRKNGTYDKIYRKYYKAIEN
jgi:membrane-bound lytic murein transglycosylase MltF